jgi:hypothetical protein
MTGISRPHRILALLLAAALLCAGLTACGVSLPSEPPGIVGTVTAIVPGDDRPASISVEGTGTQPPGTITDKALVNIPPATQFFGPDGQPASLASVGAIRKGTRVRVWFQGAVAESYPVQGSARAVQLLR